MGFRMSRGSEHHRARYLLIITKYKNNYTAFSQLPLPRPGPVLPPVAVCARVPPGTPRGTHAGRRHVGGTFRSAESPITTLICACWIHRITPTRIDHYPGHTLELRITQLRPAAAYCTTLVVEIAYSTTPRQPRTNALNNRKCPDRTRARSPMRPAYTDWRPYPTQCSSGCGLTGNM